MAHSTDAATEEALINLLYEKNQSMKIRYMHLRDCENRPVITVCIISNNVNTGIGWSICSSQDNPQKAKGRAQAFEKANEAFIRSQSKKHSNISTVDPPQRDEAWDVIDTLRERDYIIMRALISENFDCVPFL